VSLLGAGCSRRQGSTGELRLAVIYDLSSLDPHAHNTVSAYELLSSVYEPLTSLGRNLRVQPRLAESWENPDELTWVFRLRPGVRFHDGSLLTSADVAFSLQRLIDDPSLEARSSLASVASVSARDSATVVIRTRWPNAQLASRLHLALIVRRGSTAESLASRANGTGAYAVESWTAGKSLRLRRHEAHWGEGPGFDRMTIDTDVSAEELEPAFAEGRYGFAAYSASSLEPARRTGRYDFVSSPSIFLRHLAFDLSRETTPFCPGIANPFRDLRVREAIHVALDRPRLVEVVGPVAGVASQLVPKAVFGFDPSLPPFTPDLARARRLMAEAGFAGGFDVTLHRSRAFSAAAGEVQRQLSGIGVRARVVSLPSERFFAALDRRELSFWMAASGATTGDGLELLETSFHSPDPSTSFGGDNYGGYRNPALDDGIREATATFDAARRQHAVQALLRRVLEDRVWVPLYYADNVYAIARGVEYEPRDDGYLHLPEIRPARPRTSED
jgi:peptide/nickel transport system substrate-binding protein